MSMLLHAVAPDELDEPLREIFDLAVQRVGNTDFVQAGANAPELLDWYFNDFYARLFYGADRRVSVRIKEIIRLRLAKTHGCAFCNRWDTVDALNAGLSQEQCDAIVPWPAAVDESLFAADELAALRFADQMGLQNMNGHVDDELYAELRAHFDDGQIMEMGMIMAVLTGMAKFLFIADLVPKEDNCPVRPQAVI
jgi:AhpD family alkylhydroperoxidase